jgi:UDP-N-acetylglucosamine acyltransferase
MPNIHPTAIIDPAARLADTVEIGPYCVVGPDVTLEDGVRLVSHVSVTGVTTIGARTRVLAFASLGSPPQSTRYKGEKTTLVIGADCDLREHVTMNTGTVEGGGQTRVGDRALMMVGAHVAHDCLVGSDVTFANNATLGGHTIVGDRVVIGGLSGCHQFSRIGEGAMIGGCIGLLEDVIPFGLVDRDATLGGLNIIGLKRRGCAKSDLHAIRRTVRDLFVGEGQFRDRVAMVAANPPENRFARMIVDFVAADAKRPILKPGRGAAFGADEA